MTPRTRTTTPTPRQPVVGATSPPGVYMPPGANPARFDAADGPSNSITVAEFRDRVAAEAFGAKYGNRRTWVDEIGRWFSSGHEADQAVLLHRRQQAGEIRELTFQVPYRLEVNGVLVCTYVADFAYEEKHVPTTATHPLPGPVVEAELGTGAVWVSVVADAKGFATPVWKLKKRLMAACLNITVKEL